MVTAKRTWGIVGLLVCLLIAAPVIQPQPAGDDILYGIPDESGEGYSLHVLNISSGGTSNVGHIRGFGSDAGWSPDGRFIYLVNENGEAGRSLELVDVDANSRRLVTDHLDAYKCTLPLNWSPDGKLLAYYTQNGEQYVTLNVLDIVDGDVVTLPNAIGRYYYFVRWSPDGRSLAQVIVPENDQHNTVIWDVRAQRVLAKLDTEVGNRAEWSPDGAYFAYGTGQGVFVFDLRDDSVHQYNGEQIGQWSPDGRYLSYYRDEYDSGVDLFVIDTLTDEVLMFEGGNPIYFFNGWSPDSRYLVFNQWMPTDTPSRTFLLLDVTDGSTRALTDGDVYAHVATWSSSGHWLAVSANPGHDGSPVSTRLYIFDIDSGYSQHIALEIPPVYYERPLRWSPDGRYLVVWRGQDLHLYDREGGRLRELVFGVEPFTLTPRWSADGRYLSVYSIVQDHADIFVFDTTTSFRRNVTNTPGEGEVFFGWRGTGENESLIYCGEG